MNPQTRLIIENITNVMMGRNPVLSAIHPTATLNAPINPTYMAKRRVLGVVLNVNLAFAKKLNDIAIIKPIKFATD